MTITAKNIIEERKRVKNDLPVMSVITRGVAFTIEAGKLFNFPCKLSFDKGNGNFVCYYDDNDGFQLYEYHGVYRINSIPLQKLLEEIFGKRKPSFYIRTTENSGTFELKLLEK